MGILINVVLLLYLNGVHMKDIPKPVGFWPLNEGTKTRDVSGNEFNFETNQEMKFAPGPCGQETGAYEITATTQSLRLKYSETFPTTPDVSRGFTLLAFLYPMANTSPFKYFDWNTIPDRLADYISIHQLRPYAFFHPRTDTWYEGSYSNLKLELKKWQFVGVSYNNNTGSVAFCVDASCEVLEAEGNRQRLKGMHRRTNSDVRITDGSSQSQGWRMASLRLYNVYFETEDMLKHRKFRCVSGCLPSYQEATFRIYSDITTPTTTFSKVKGLPGLDCLRRCLQNVDCVMTYYKDGFCFVSGNVDVPLMAGGNLEIYRIKTNTDLGW